MAYYEDIVSDKLDYATWAASHYSLEDLQDMVGQAIYDGGYTVSDAFKHALGTEPSGRRALAGFLAENTCFDVEDAAWLAHCDKACFGGEHPSLTTAERNGLEVA